MSIECTVEERNPFQNSIFPIPKESSNNIPYNDQQLGRINKGKMKRFPNSKKQRRP